METMRCRSVSETALTFAKAVANQISVRVPAASAKPPVSTWCSNAAQETAKMNSASNLTSMRSLITPVRTWKNGNDRTAITGGRTCTTMCSGTPTPYASTASR